MMRKQNILRTLFFLLVVTIALFAISALRDKPVMPGSACKESLEDCPKQQKSGLMMWDNLSNPFFSTI
jgi:hypothetical protein